jgi:hypothetical protein
MGTSWGVGSSTDRPATRNFETELSKIFPTAWCGSTKHGREIQVWKMLEDDLQELALLKAR